MPETWPFAEQDLTDRKRPASGRGSGASHEIGLNGGRALTTESAPRTHVFAERDLNGVERSVLRRGASVPTPDTVHRSKSDTGFQTTARSRFDLASILLLIFCLFSAENPPALGAQSKMEPKQTSRFRTSEEKVHRKIELNPKTPSDGISKGLVIAYGHPLRPPYKFRETEDSLEANGVQIWPTLIERKSGTDSPRPRQGTDVVAKEFPKVVKEARTKYWELKGNVPEPEVHEKVREHILKNRKVLDARWDSDKVLALRFVGVPDGGRFRYTISIGDKNRLTPSAPEQPDASAASKKRLAGIEASLRKGECVIFPSTMGGTIHVRITTEEIMAIMDSDSDRSQKIDALEKKVRSLVAALDILENYDATEWKSAHNP